MKQKLEQAVLVNKRASASVALQEEIHLISPDKETISSLYPYWCVIMNLIFGLSGLIILLLILPVLALLIYIDSPGPIFYTQERLGYKGRPFRMYKLRSMHAAVGRTKHIILTAQHDPRVTRVGHMLRITHLDELPQVINILLGQMSLVGPRPELANFTTKLADVMPQYHNRLQVKPGLTGCAQVMHNYGDSIKDEELKLKYDLYYIANQSCQLDIQVILKTVGEVLSGHGR
jgi:lipopolysaccharide/colanic/teichoic acid biosynthesis glycosyltransferase